MSQSETVGERVRRWAEDGQLYVLAGVLSALLAWLVIPLAGIAGAYAGYRVYTETDRDRVAIAIVFSSLPALLAPFAIVALG